MGRYLIRRFLAAVFTLWAVATLLFLLLPFFPGSPFDQEMAIAPEFRAQLEATYGVTGSWVQRYFTFLGSCLEGHFGNSLQSQGQSVAQVLIRALEPSSVLNLSALALTVCLGLILGLAPHLKPGWPQGTRGLTRAGLALPALFLAPLLLWLFCFKWDFFPLRADGSAISLLLPIFVLSFRPACGLGRILDQRLREQSMQNFARTFRSLGVSDNRLAWRWLLRSSLIAFVQQLPQIAAILLSGSLLVEPIFGIQGLGALSVTSLLERDWPVAMGLTLFFSAVLVISQWAADVAMLALDPRTRPT